MGTHPIFESDFDCLTEKNIHDFMYNTGAEAQSSGAKSCVGKASKKSYFESRDVAQPFNNMVSPNNNTYQPYSPGYDQNMTSPVIERCMTPPHQQINLLQMNRQRLITRKFQLEYLKMPTKCMIQCGMEQKQKVACLI